MGHFLDDETECADTFLLFVVVVVGLGGEEEGVVGRAGGGRAVGREAWEKRGVGAVDGASAEGAKGGGGGGGGGAVRGQLGEDKVVLVLDPGVDAGIAGGGGVGEELGEEGRVGSVVVGHGLHRALGETDSRAPFYEWVCRSQPSHPLGPPLLT